MITINKYKNQFNKTAIKLNNVSSVNEGWQYINQYAEIFCLKSGYDEYGICEFYENMAGASVVYFRNNDIKGTLSFDISEFEKFSDFRINRPYIDFVYSKVGKEYRPLQQGISAKDIMKLNKLYPDLRDNGFLKIGKPDDGCLPDPIQVQICLDWLKTKILTPTKTVSFNSSNIKSLIKQELKTYVTDGAVVAAVLLMEIPYKRIGGSNKINVFLLKREILG